MKDDLLASLFWRFAAISLVSVGGATAVLPEVHRQLVEETGWLSARRFADLFALAQTAPGPNVIAFSLFGWELAGLAGLAVVTVAALAPAGLLAFAVSRALGRAAQSVWIARLKAALTPLAIGLMLASGFLLTQAAGRNLPALIVTVAAAALVIFTRANPLIAIAGGAGAFVAAARLGLA